MHPSESYWLLSNGFKLFAQDWNHTDPTRAVVCLVHGIGEHSGRYQHVAEFLNNHNIAMLAFDLRGHGKSDGLRGHIDSYDLFLDDIDRLIQEAGQRYPDAPVFLYGHSLGGNLIIYHALKRKSQVAGIISTGPVMVPDNVPPLKLLLGKALYSLMPTFRMTNSLDRTGLSRDPLVVEKYNQDPLVHNKISTRLGLDMLESGKWLIAHASEITVPLLVMQGSADRLVSVRATREFIQSTPPDMVLYKEWENAYHELHNDVIKDEVLKYVLDWIESKLI